MELLDFQDLDSNLFGCVLFLTLFNSLHFIPSGMHGTLLEIIGIFDFIVSIFFVVNIRKFSISSVYLYNRIVNDCISSFGF
jgi:hypothetical protein